MIKKKYKPLIFCAVFTVCVTKSLLGKGIISVNNGQFTFPTIEGFTLVTDREEMKKIFPLLEQDYRHITHFVAFQEEQTRNSIVGRFTTPTRSINARIKPRSEFIRQLIDLKYDKELADKLHEGFKKAQSIIETSELDFSLQSIKRELVSPVIIDHDDNGFYQALVTEGIRYGENFTQATIASGTVVNNMVFTLYISKDYSSTPPHPELLAISKKFIAKFIQLNER